MWKKHLQLTVLQLNWWNLTHKWVERRISDNPEGLSLSRQFLSTFAHQKQKPWKCLKFFISHFIKEDFSFKIP